MLDKMAKCVLVEYLIIGEINDVILINILINTISDVRTYQNAISMVCGNEYNI